MYFIAERSKAMRITQSKTAYEFVAAGKLTARALAVPDDRWLPCCFPEAMPPKCARGEGAEVGSPFLWGREDAPRSCLLMGGRLLGPWASW